MLVPGALGLTGVSELVVGQSGASIQDVVQTLLTIVAISLGMMVGASLIQTAAKPASWLDAPPEIRPAIVTPPPALRLPSAGVPRTGIRFRPDAAYRQLVTRATRKPPP
jgi:hypothetical protein